MGYEDTFERIERQRAALLARLEPLDEGLMTRSPAEGGWSVAQVVCHLSGAERRSLDYIRKKTQDPSRLWDAGPGAAMRSLILTVALRSHLRFSVPSTLPQVPDAGDWPTEKRRWDQVRSDWREWLTSFPAELAGKAVFKHPRAGYQTLRQALRFMAEHTRHHAKQVDRILARIG